MYQKVVACVLKSFALLSLENPTRLTAIAVRMMPRTQAMMAMSVCLFSSLLFFLSVHRAFIQVELITSLLVMK